MASGVAEGLFGTLCVLNDTGEDRKSEGTNKFPDIWTITLEKMDDQFSSLKTVSALGRPEFFQGKLNSDASSQVKKAVNNSRHCRDMCADWAEHAFSLERKSKINEKILTWCLKEFSRAGLECPIVDKAGLERCTVKRERGAHQIDAADSESSSKSSLGLHLKRFLLCGYRPVDAKQGEKPKRNEGKIFVQRIDGTIFSVNMNADTPQNLGKVCKESDLILTDKVGMLKNAIHLDKGVPPDLQFLVFQNTILEDHKMLHDYGILPNKTVYLIQLRSALGVEETVDVRATEARGLEFKEKKFSGLYRWYRDGQLKPDVYMGEFLNGMLFAV